jgi:hypothetical protein
MKAITKLTVHTVSIFLLLVITCQKTNAEPMETLPSKDAVKKLIAQANKSKKDKNLVDNLLAIARYYLHEGDNQCEKYLDRALSLSENLAYNDGLIKSMCLQATFMQNVKNDTTSASVALT